MAIGAGESQADSASVSAARAICARSKTAQGCRTEAAKDLSHIGTEGQIRKKAFRYEIRIAFDGVSFVIDFDV